MTGVMHQRPKRTHTVIAIIFIVATGDNKIEEKKTHRTLVPKYHMPQIHKAM